MAKETGVKTGDDQQGKAGPDDTVIVEPGDDQSQGGKGKTFTQEQLNEIVSKRINETKAKFKDAERKATVYDNMMKDNDVLQFMENLRDGKRPVYTDEKASISESAFSKLQSLDPEVATAAKAYLDSELNRYKDATGQSIDQIRAQQAEAVAVQELKAMEEAKDTVGKPMYPWLEDQAFREEMAGLLESGRAHQLMDAYDIASVGRFRRGDMPPGEKREAKKKDAELLESESVGSLPGDSSKIDPNKRYKSVEECMNELADKRGWFK